MRDLAGHRDVSTNELDAFSRAFGLPVLWFLLPPEPEDTDRPLPEGWVRRLLWSESVEIADRVDALRPERRRRALDQRLADADEAVLDALAARSGRKLARWSRELREVADALARAGRRRGG